MRRVQKAQALLASGILIAPPSTVYKESDIGPFVCSSELT